MYVLSAPREDDGEPEGIRISGRSRYYGVWAKSTE